MSYFIYNGISSENMGLKIISMSPAQRAEQRNETITVSGRSEPFFQVYDEYNSFNIDISCVITDISLQRNIFSWLVGNGILIQSDELDKYYTVKACSLISVTRISDEIRELTASFECMPYAYSVSNEAVVLENYGTVTNNGSVPSEPIITISGSGNIELSVNGEVWKLADVDSSITIDTKRRLVYKDNTVLLNKVSRYDDKVYLPMLNVGNNLILSSGNVSSISVIKNERWL